MSEPAAPGWEKDDATGRLRQIGLATLGRARLMPLTAVFVVPPVAVGRGNPPLTLRRLEYTVDRPTVHLGL